MVNSQVIALALAFVGLASALPSGILVNPNPAYQYSYGVNDNVSGDRKTQTEARNGGVVSGSYSVVQPDGVTRTVNYIADPINGFRAQVLNDGVDVTGRQATAAPAAVLTPVQDTPEVAAARADHLRAVDEARARNAAIAATAAPVVVAAPVAPVIVVAPGQDTPEVAAARAEHLAAVAEARARNAALAATAPPAPPAPVAIIASAPIAPASETPEVAAARAAHLAAHAEVNARNAAILNRTPLALNPFIGGWPNSGFLLNGGIGLKAILG